MGSSVKAHLLALCVYKNRGTQRVYKALTVEKEREIFFQMLILVPAD